MELQHYRLRTLSYVDFLVTKQAIRQYMALQVI